MADKKELIAKWKGAWKDSNAAFCFQYHISEKKLENWLQRDEAHDAEVTWAVEQFLKGIAPSCNYAMYLRSKLISPRELLAKLCSQILLLKNLFFIDGDNWTFVGKSIKLGLEQNKLSSYHFVIVCAKDSFSEHFNGLENFPNNISILFAQNNVKQAADITLSMLLLHVATILKPITNTVKFYLCSFDSFIMETKSMMHSLGFDINSVQNIQHFFDLLRVNNDDIGEQQPRKILNKASQEFIYKSPPSMLVNSNSKLDAKAADPHTKSAVTHEKTISSNQIEKVDTQNNDQKGHEQKHQSEASNLKTEQDLVKYLRDLDDFNLSQWFWKFWTKTQTAFSREYGIDPGNFSKWLRGLKHSPASREKVISFLILHKDKIIMNEN